MPTLSLQTTPKLALECSTNWSQPHNRTPDAHLRFAFQLTNEAGVWLNLIYEYMILADLPGCLEYNGPGRSVHFKCEAFTPPMPEGPGVRAQATGKIVDGLMQNFNLDVLTALMVADELYDLAEELHRVGDAYFQRRVRGFSRRGARRARKQLLSLLKTLEERGVAS